MQCALSSAQGITQPLCTAPDAPEAGLPATQPVWIYSHFTAHLQAVVTLAA